MQEIFSALELKQDYTALGSSKLDSVYEVSKLASASIGAVGASIAGLRSYSGVADESLQVKVDQRLASLWFGYSIQPVDWQMPPIWDAIAGDYQTKDGWIKLHTNLAHHRAAACRVLDCTPDRELVKKRVAAWSAVELESEIVTHGGVAAAMRSHKDWLLHKQGSSVSKEPLIQWRSLNEGVNTDWLPSTQIPLKGIKVLDLTRVLAGPVATRTLAGFGAEVLRIDPPSWDEPNVVPDVTIGKRCAHLDLTTKFDRSRLANLLREADVFVHGYRPGALDGLGVTQDWRREHAPELIEISLDAYGWTGPWSGRRGFDSLVQMSCGIAHAGMKHYQRDVPTPLPVQALDHATGYLMAAAAIKALSAKLSMGEIKSAKLSLARTAETLMGHPQTSATPTDIGSATEADYQQTLEPMPWGNTKRLVPPLQVGDIAMRWPSAAAELGSSPAQWLHS